MMLGVENVAVAPAGKPLTANETSPSNPPTEVTVNGNLEVTP